MSQPRTTAPAGLRRHLPPFPIDPDLEPDDPGAPSPGHHGALHGGRGIGRTAPSVLLSVAAGGFLGTLARYGAGLALPDPGNSFPLPTLVINVSGSLLLGFCLALIVERASHAPHLRGFACTGVLGGWTTMSTLAVGADQLLRDGHTLAGIGYLAATLAGGLTAVVVGMLAARRLVGAPA